MLLLQSNVCIISPFEPHPSTFPIFLDSSQIACSFEVVEQLQQILNFKYDYFSKLSIYLTYLRNEILLISLQIVPFFHWFLPDPFWTWSTIALLFSLNLISFCELCCETDWFHSYMNDLCCCKTTKFLLMINEQYLFKYSTNRSIRSVLFIYPQYPNISSFMERSKTKPNRHWMILNESLSILNET